MNTDEMKKMTKAEVAKELLDPYFISHDLCSHDGGNCLYNGPGGRKCAFAAACVDGVKLEEGEDANYQLNASGQEILKEKYRHIYDRLFWCDLQYAHDSLASGQELIAKHRYKKLTGQEPPEPDKLTGE